MSRKDIGASVPDQALAVPATPANAVDGPTGFDPSRGYSVDDLREAFKAGWKVRNASPGLKRRAKKSLNNAMLNAMGGGRYAELEYVPDARTFHVSIWLNSNFRKAMAGAAK